MRILVLTERFFPEEFLVNDLVRAWTAAGHKVSVLTQEPSYPHDRLFDGYRNRLYRVTREMPGVTVHRVRTVLGYNRSVFRKVLNYVSFAFLTCSWAIAAGWRYDRVFAYHTGPLTMATAAVPLHFLWRRKIAIWTQDLWPDAVYAYGFKKSRVREFLLDAFVRLVYASCRAVAVSCPAYVQALSARIRRPVEFVPQWDVGGRELPEKPSGGKLVFTFTGNIGVPQELPALARGFAAAGLENAELHIVGGGVKLEELRDTVERGGLRNIVVHGRRPHSEMEKFLAAADVLVLPLSSKFALTLPGKFQAYLKAGRPIFGAIEGAAADFIRDCGLGVAVKPGDEAEIARGFREMASRRAEFPVWRRNALALSSERFDRERTIARLTRMVADGQEAAQAGAAETGKED